MFCGRRCFSWLSPSQREERMMRLRVWNVPLMVSYKPSVFCFVGDWTRFSLLKMFQLSSGTLNYHDPDECLSSHFAVIVFCASFSLSVWRSCSSEGGLWCLWPGLSSRGARCLTARPSQVFPDSRLDICSNIGQFDKRRLTSSSTMWLPASTTLPPLSL